MKILDIGCGDGILTEMVANAYPQASITGLDIIPTVGSMFRGNRNRVNFVNDSVENFAAANNDIFDLVIISDVIHHVAPHMQRNLLVKIKKVSKSDGRFIIKEWQQTKTPIHFFAYCADRYISNNRPYFNSKAKMRQLLIDVFGVEQVQKETWIQPWRNNIIFLVKT